jgi:methyl-accepting chemotaxis protein
MKEGNLPKRIKLRKGDYLLKEAEVINQMLESLRVKVQGIQEAQTYLNKAISECKDVVGHASNDEILQRVNDLAEKGDQLGEKLAYFKIAS